jgi:hypothetical protein
MITIILGAVHALLSYGIIWAYSEWFGSSSIAKGWETDLLLILLLTGFVTMFGFTFPARWFRTPKKEKQV